MAQTEPGVLVYNGKSYAVGLLWFTVQEDNAKSLLQQRIQKTHADFYAARTHVSQQQGFGWLNKGHRRGMPAAAAMVADQLVGEWHGVFEADNGWWYVQVRSDTITPNGDQFFTTEEEAFNLFQSEMQRHNWPHAYAPEKWRINDTNVRELSLRNFLSDLVTTKLSAANVSAAFGGAAQRNVILGSIGLIVAAMIGVVLYTLLKPQDISIPVSKIKPSTTQPVVVKETANTEEFFSPIQMLQQCGAAADKMMTPLPGWEVQKFACGDNKAILTWQQVGGTLSDAKARGFQTWPQGTSVTFKSRIMTVMLGLDKLPKLQPEELVKQEDALLALEQDLQPLGALQVKPVVPPPPPTPRQRSRLDGPPPPPPPAPPPYLDIQFISGFSPEKIGPLLDAPGLEVVSVDWAIARGIWQYKLKWTHARTKVATQPAAAPVNSAAAKAAAIRAARGQKK